MMSVLGGSSEYCKLLVIVVLGSACDQTVRKPAGRTAQILYSLICFYPLASYQKAWHFSNESQVPIAKHQKGKGIAPPQPDSAQSADPVSIGPPAREALRLALTLVVHDSVRRVSGTRSRTQKPVYH